MKTMRLDDWFIIPSTMLTVLMTVFICLNAKAGGGNHVWDIKKDNLVWMVKVSLRDTREQEGGRGLG